MISMDIEQLNHFFFLKQLAILIRRLSLSICTFSAIFFTEVLCITIDKKMNDRILLEKGFQWKKSRKY